MVVTVRNNDNTETVYSFEPGAGKAVEAEKFYSDLYRNLKIQGFKVEDGTGKVLSFRGAV